MEISEVEIRPAGLRWLEKGDPHDDYCVHGGIFLRLGDAIISDGVTEWTVSTAAFRLLGTVSNDHNTEMDEALIPCCGFNMWPEKSARDGIYIPNCSNGIDWVVRHPAPNVIEHAFADNQILYTNREQWTKAAIEFSDPIRAFYSTAWPKNFYDEESRLGFERFLSLWDERRRSAELINAGGNNN